MVMKDKSKWNEIYSVKLNFDRLHRPFKKFDLLSESKIILIFLNFFREFDIKLTEYLQAFGDIFGNVTK